MAIEVIMFFKKRAKGRANAQPPKYYTTPPGDVLNPLPPSRECSAIDCPSIERIFTYLGAPCTVVSQIAGPNAVIYGVDLADVRRLKKALTFAPGISALVKLPVTISTATKTHLTVVITKAERNIVPLRGALQTRHYNDFKDPLPAALGATMEYVSLVASIAKMPHMLIAGATGSGKSVLLHSIINGLLFRETPSTVRLVMIDAKRVELTPYNPLPHMLSPVVEDYETAVHTLSELCRIMDTRYKNMQLQGVNDITGTSLPRIVIIIDELADLMLVSRATVEPYIVRIAQLGRAAGIHLIIATQRPTVNVITGLIKANIPCRVAMQMASSRDSVTILDHKGAEALLGRGDALVKLPDQVKEIRVQSPYITPGEIRAVVNYWQHDAVHEGIPPD